MRECVCTCVGKAERKKNQKLTLDEAHTVNRHTHTLPKTSNGTQFAIFNLS